MNIENRIKNPAIIAVSVEGAVFLISTILLLCQKPLVKELYYGVYERGEGIVIPASYISALLIFGLMVAYMLVLYNYTGNHRKGIGIAMIAVYAGVQTLGFILNLVVPMVIGRVMGTYQLSLYSTVSSLMSVPAGILGFVPVPLFFFSLGRYTLTVSE